MDSRTVNEVSWLLLVYLSFAVVMKASSDERIMGDVAYVQGNTVVCFPLIWTVQCTLLFRDEHQHFALG